MKEEFSWLAGFLEGEGTFSYHEGVSVKSGKAYPRRSWSIKVSSTDLDVIERAAGLMGSRVAGPYRVASAKGEKPIWCTSLSRRSEVIALCLMLRPEMGARRQAQIDRLLREDTRG